MRKSLFFIVLLFSSSSYSQSKLDSLESILANQLEDSVRIVVLLQLSDEYSYEEPSKAKKLLLQAINLSEKANFSFLMVEGYNKLGNFLSVRASYDSAILEYEKAILLAERIKLNSGKTEALIGLGNSYWRKGNLKKAQEYQEKNIEFSRSVNDPDGIASSYNNLGNIYNEMGEYAKAMEHYTQASKKYTEIGNDRNAGIAMANIGLIHQKIENYKDAINYYLLSDSIFKKQQFLGGSAFVMKNLAIVYKNIGNLEESLNYSNQALEIYNKTGQLREIGQIIHTIGNLYWEQNDFQTALGYYEKAYAINIQIGDSIGIAMTSQAIATNYLSLGQLDTAQAYAQKALDIATKLGIMLTAMDASKTLADASYIENNFRIAYDYLKVHGDLRDSLYTIEKRDLASEIEAKYQNEQKAREIALLETENKLKTLQVEKRGNERNGLIILSIVILLVLGLLINRYRIKLTANKQLKDLDRIKSVFFENLSHEFRTPLTLITAPLRDRIAKPISAEDERLLSTVLRNAENLDDLIKQLLDLAKLEKGKYEVATSEVEVFHFLKIIAASYHSLASVKEIDFKIAIPNQEQWVELDQELIKKICNNLLSNAFKFTPPQGTIRFEASYDRSLFIQVSDSGSGISKEDQQKVFERFYQGKGQNSSGTGIGLALTKELVGVVGGQIRLESNLGTGSTFYVSLPVKELSQHSDHKTAFFHTNSKQHRLPTEPNFSEEKQNLLIIEDNEDLRAYLFDLFSQNFNVHLAADGKQGINVATETIPDIIISDIMMAEMNGLEVCQQLKSDEKTDHIPIILLTARSDQKTKLSGLEFGADAYLLKPFESDELKVTVHNLILQRQKLRNKYASVLKEGKKVEDAPAPPFIKRCEEIVNQHLSNDALTVDDFAKEIGMSRMQIHRKLKALTGLSATAFIRQYRLIKAKELLEKGEPVSQVAYAVGFSSLAYFSKSFKEEHGQLPSHVTSKDV